jgi:hypothetical protein
MYYVGHMLLSMVVFDIERLAESLCLLAIPQHARESSLSDCHGLWNVTLWCGAAEYDRERPHPAIVCAVGLQCEGPQGGDSRCGKHPPDNTESVLCCW